MTIKLEAAYHEAAHAIIANQSKFYEVNSGIDLGPHGRGGIDIRLSKEKLKKEGKSEEVASAHDPEVTKDLALVLTAGYAAEQIAQEKNGHLKPNLRSAKIDHDLLTETLVVAGLSRKFDFFETQVTELLKEKWASVEKIAARLFEAEKLSQEDLTSLLDET